MLGSGRPRNPHLIETRSSLAICTSESGRWISLGGSIPRKKISFRWSVSLHVSYRALPRERCKRDQIGRWNSRPDRYTCLDHPVEDRRDSMFRGRLRNVSPEGHRHTSPTRQLVSAIQRWHIRWRNYHPPALCQWTIIEVLIESRGSDYYLDAVRGLKTVDSGCRSRGDEGLFKTCRSVVRLLFTIWPVRRFFAEHWYGPASDGFTSRMCRFPLGKILYRSRDSQMNVVVSWSIASSYSNSVRSRCDDDRSKRSESLEDSHWALHKGWRRCCLRWYWPAEYRCSLV